MEPADRPYYYVLDWMYNVRALVDRAGSIVERYCYDPYGKPLIRESLGRGDQNGQDTILGLGDATAFAATTATPPTMWDPRADMDDDGDIDATDVTLKSAKAANWPNPGSEPTVSQAFGDVGNRYMFQGVPHFAIDTSSSDTTVKFPLNHHRARFAEPVTGRWITRDPQYYNVQVAITLEAIHRIHSTSLLEKYHNSAFSSKNTTQVIRDRVARSLGSQRTEFTFEAYELEKSNQSRFLYYSLDESPMRYTDPFGLWCLRLYGNWCGDNWSGGVCVCDQVTNPPKCSCTDGTAAPVDGVDSCCQAHDNCFSSMGDNHPQCQNTMCDCLLNESPSPTNRPIWRNMIWFFCGFDPDL